jgi:hypothetical protein
MNKRWAFTIAIRVGSVAAGVQSVPPYVGVERVPSEPSARLLAAHIGFVPIEPERPLSDTSFELHAER